MTFVETNLCVVCTAFQIKGTLHFYLFEISDGGVTVEHNARAAPRGKPGQLTKISRANR